jgi:hypothetical protein
MKSHGSTAEEAVLNVLVLGSLAPRANVVVMFVSA